jgi:hypothetical protein
MGCGAIGRGAAGCDSIGKLALKVPFFYSYTLFLFPDKHHL